MDFAEKVNSGTVNKRAMEALIKSGAFDGLEGNRAQMLAVYEKVLEGFSQKNKKNIEGQVSLFGDILEEDTSMHISFPSLKESDKKDLFHGKGNDRNVPFRSSFR